MCNVYLEYGYGGVVRARVDNLNYPRHDIMLPVLVL